MYFEWWPHAELLRRRRCASFDCDVRRFRINHSCCKSIFCFFEFIFTERLFRIIIVVSLSLILRWIVMSSHVRWIEKSYPHIYSRKNLLREIRNLRYVCVKWRFHLSSNLETFMKEIFEFKHDFHSSTLVIVDEQTTKRIFLHENAFDLQKITRVSSVSINRIRMKFEPLFFFQTCR